MHPDCQPMALQCPTVLESVTVKGKYSDVFQENVNSEITQTIVKIEKLRQEHLSSRNIETYQ